MDIIADRAKEIGMATIFITHDLALAAQRASRIVVMHAGHIVEMAETDELFRNPQHPYTRKLIAAVPDAVEKLADLSSIPGSLPDLRAASLPSCRYSARCERHIAACDQPLPAASGQSHYIACWNPVT